VIYRAQIHKKANEILVGKKIRKEERLFRSHTYIWEDNIKVGGDRGSTVVKVLRYKSEASLVRSQLVSVDFSFT
jgi:hypothetical protein